jgi:ABC-type multidrug transport system ATPase subunit
MADEMSHKTEAQVDVAIPIVKASITNTEALEIAVQNISYNVKVSKPKEKGAKAEIIDKKILENITGVFRAGRLTAVMGASGAGKTSLLNVLVRKSCA